MTQQIRAAQREWARAMGEGCVERMSAMSNRLEVLRRLQNSRRAVRRSVNAIRIVYRGR